MVTITAWGESAARRRARVHPVLAALGADDDADALCPTGLLDDGKPSAQKGIPAHFLCGSCQGIERHDPRFRGKGNADRVEEPGTDKEDLVSPRFFCRGKTAAEHLPPAGCPALPVSNPDIDAPFFQERFHRRDQVDVLDGRDKTRGLSFEEREGIFQHCDIEVNLVWQEDDPVLRVDRRMADMDEHVGMVEGIECKVAGPVAGIAADDNLEPRVLQGTGLFSCTPFQAGRKLEGDHLCPPLPQLPDKIRDIV